jgi:putative DNA primase/helicase
VRSADKPTPYGLRPLEDARKATFVVLVEGESDCHTLWYHEIPALGLPGASNWRDGWASHLDGIEKIYAVIESDQGGETTRTPAPRTSPTQVGSRNASRLS